MKSVSRFALGAALVFGTASVLATAPADAKKKDPPAAAAQPGQRQFTFSKEERAALAPLQTAVTAKDWAAAKAALPAAQAAAQGSDARFAVGTWQLSTGLGLQDLAMQAQAIDAILASGGAAPADLRNLYYSQGTLALNAGNRQKAETAFSRLVEVSPNDSEGLIELARVKSDLRKPQEAVQLIDRAIGLKKAANQVADESWYRYALKLAYDGKMTPQALKLGRELVAAYPSAVNWRDSLLIYRDLSSLDKPAALDLMRLMRASGALSGERDWFDLAYELDNGGLPGEAKAVLEEGSRLKMVDLNKAAFRELLAKASGRVAGDRASLSGDAAKALAAASGTPALRIADAFLGYGDYARAAELYRAALQKGSVDAGLANTRLGIALALAGNRAEAEAAFRAVTGPRAELASYWLAWLARRG
jgi:tetratricopeptide (TPR) repeat protein